MANCGQLIPQFGDGQAYIESFKSSLEYDMKIIVMGAAGKIGVEVVSALAPNHTVISTGREVDYTDAESVRSMYRENEDFDGLVCVVGGDSVFKSFEELTDEDFAVGFQRKIYGTAQPRSHWYRVRKRGWVIHALDRLPESLPKSL